MNGADWLAVFRDELQRTRSLDKNFRQFTREDLERVSQAFEATLQNPEMPADLLLQLITGERR